MAQHDENVVWHAHPVTAQQREQLHGHRGVVLWFTGLSGSGKSTVAGALEEALRSRNIPYKIYGGMSFYQRKEIKDMLAYRAERQMVRERVGDDRFFEVFVDTSLATCEARDPKGLYKKARAGELRNFTGIDSSYESPERPAVRLDGEQLVTNLVAQLLDLLKQSDIIRS